MSKIQFVSQCFKRLLQIILIAMPITLILFWLHAPAPLSAALNHFGFNISYIPDGTAILYQLTWGTKILGLIISLIPFSIYSFVVILLIKLFSVFSRAEIFSQNNVTRIKKIGFLIFLGELINPLYQALMTAAMTWHNPAGQHFIKITLSGMNIGLILMSCLILLLAWIMSEANKINEENKLTV